MEVRTTKLFISQVRRLFDLFGVVYFPESVLILLCNHCFTWLNPKPRMFCADHVNGRCDKKVVSRIFSLLIALEAFFLALIMRTNERSEDLKYSRLPAEQ